MKRIVVLLAVGPMLACSGGRPLVTAADLQKAAKTNQIQTINDAINGTHSAVQAAFAASALPAANQTDLPAQQKVQKMANLIKSGNCVQNLVPPAERFDQDWSSNWTVQDQGSATSCPLYLYEASSFSNSNDQWLTNKSWTIRSTEFQNVYGMQTLNVRGALNATFEGVKRVIGGRIYYRPFVVAGLGQVTADVVIDSSYSGFSGSGSITLTLYSGASTTVAAINWQGSGVNPTFTVDGVAMDQKTFVGLFSAFELVEIMDRSLKMR